MQCHLVSHLYTLLRLGMFTASSGWDIHDAVYTRELAISNRENGYRDVLAQVDLSTYRRIPWEDNVPFFLVSFLDPVSLKPICVDPRGVLRLTCERALEMNLKCVAGVEYEVSFPTNLGRLYLYRAVFQLQRYCCITRKSHLVLIYDHRDGRVCRSEKFLWASATHSRKSVGSIQSFGK